MSTRDPKAKKAERALDAAGGLIHRGGIAARLESPTHPGFGLTIQAATRLTNTLDFPKPYTTLGGWPIWIVADVVAWAAERDRVWHKDALPERT